MNNLNDILKDRVINKVYVEENTILIHLKPKEKPLPKSWEEFCEMYPIKKGECYIGGLSDIVEYESDGTPRVGEVSKNFLPDRASAEAVLALCQLIQLRDAYNGDWVPDWKDGKQTKFVIAFANNVISSQYFAYANSEILYFKTKELRDEFLRNFRDLIEKLKPLYGIKEGGEK